MRNAVALPPGVRDTRSRSADVRTWLTSSLLFPLHERLRGRWSAPYRRELERSQWWSREAIESERVRRLRAMLVHAGEHVPYYRRLFDAAAFDPTAITRVADLARLPLLTKPLIRSNLEALKADDARDLRRSTTGGSTGDPLSFFVGRERASHDIAARWRATRWWGVDIGDPEVRLWASPIELRAQDRLREARDFVFRTKLLPAFELSDRDLDRYLVEIRTRRPRVLFGYPSALARLGRHARAKEIAMDDLGIEVVFSSAEMLHEDERAVIEKVFACRVASSYNTRDAGLIAHECPDGGMHISAEDVIVEIVTPSGEPLPTGTTGEVVVTHLATRAFPFVRYRIGDLGALDARPCACGRGLPLLSNLKGRSSDCVVAPDGKVMSGHALVHVMRELPGIAQFRIVQESRSQIRVLIVPTGSLSPGVETQIRNGFMQRLGAEVEVRIECADQLAVEPSGKFRFVVSRVAS